MDRDDQLIYEGWKDIAAAGALALGAACSPDNPEACPPGEKPIAGIQHYKMGADEAEAIGLDPDAVDKAIAQQNEIQKRNLQAMIDNKDFMNQVRNQYDNMMSSDNNRHRAAIRNDIIKQWEQYKQQNGIDIPAGKKAFEVPLSK